MNEVRKSADEHRETYNWNIRIGEDESTDFLAAVQGAEGLLVLFIHGGLLAKV